MMGSASTLCSRASPTFPSSLKASIWSRAVSSSATSKTLANNTMQATVFVPDGKLELFLNKFTAYRDEDTTPRGGAPLRARKIRIWSRASATSNSLHSKRYGPKKPFPFLIAMCQSHGNMASPIQRC